VARADAAPVEDLPRGGSSERFGEFDTSKA
jgi:hypothetical protein